MIRSMTGFARTTGRRGKNAWSVEIRSLNHRYFELSLKTPPSLYSLEDRIRELCQSQIKRGKVTISINEAGNGAGLEDLTLDEKVLQFYLSVIRRVQRRFRLEGTPSISDLLALSRIFSMEKKTENMEKIWLNLKALLKEALERLVESRIREGRELARDLSTRIEKIEKRLLFIEQRAKNLPQEYYEKLKQRIRDLVDEKTAEDERVWREAAFLAERADATEEIVRLRSHLSLFREKLKHQTEVGKELDFILQEMNRETNTLSAKGQDFGISKEVVSVKAELEKIREQIQNIE